MPASSPAKTALAVLFMLLFLAAITIPTGLWRNFLH